MEIKNMWGGGGYGEGGWEGKYRGLVKENQAFGDINEKLKIDVKRLKADAVVLKADGATEKISITKLKDEIELKNEHLASYAEKFAKIQFKNDELQKRIVLIEKNSYNTQEASSNNNKVVSSLETTNSGLVNANNELKSIIEDYERD
jgi:hypothetical protein